jgi:hypothetical protein
MSVKEVTACPENGLGDAICIFLDSTVTVENRAHEWPELQGPLWKKKDGIRLSSEMQE